MVRFIENGKNYGGQTAYRVLDGENTFDISFERFFQEAEICAYNLSQKMGDVKGKRIGILCNSTYEYVALVTAIVFSRGIAVPLNIRESIDTLNYEIENAELACVITDNDMLASLSTKIELLSLTDFLKDNGGKIELKDFAEDEKNKAAFMIYTSGTTGRPKGVVLSAGNMFEIEKTLFDDNVPMDDHNLRVYTNFPFYHIGGLLSWVTHFEKGCATYLSKNPGNVLMDLENEVIDVAAVIPATLNLWKKSILRGKLERLGQMKLVITAGAPIDVNTVELFLENGIHYGQYYGMSESSGNITFNFDCQNHLKSVGRPDNCVEVSIIDDEICVKSPSVMKGYYKNEEETKKSIIDGILHTGDLGYIDDEGYVYITGRKKNLIILSGGENVSPEELEKELYKCEFIQECKVFAENDRICTTVFTSEGHDDAVLEYINELNTRLPIFKRIYKKNIVHEPLEKTATGKIKR